MKDSDDIDELYEWVNKRYEEYTEGKISEEEYIQDLEYYKKKLAESEEHDETEDKSKKSSDEKREINTKKVRSTSIAGLRKKLMEEMNE